MSRISVTYKRNEGLDHKIDNGLPCVGMSHIWASGVFGPPIRKNKASDNIRKTCISIRLGMKEDFPTWSDAEDLKK
jgi:hypothetical protein